MPRRAKLAQVFAKLGLALATLLAAVAAAPAQTPKVRLVLDFAFQGQHAPFFLAVEGGYFARGGVEVEIDRGYGSGDSIVKVASRAYDMAFADLGAMIQFAGRQGEGRVVDVFQVYDVAPMVVMSLRKTGLRRPAELAGRRVAAVLASGSRVMFPLLAAANGLAVDGIKWIDVTPQLRETLLVRGDADATVALITDLAGLNRLGIHDEDLAVMRYSDFGVSTYGNCIVTTPQFAEKNPAAVKAVVAGLAAALKAAIADPDAAIAAEKKHNALQDDAVERARLDLILKNAIVTDEVRRNGLGSVEPARLRAIIDMVAKTFAIPAPDPAAVYRTDFLPAQAALMIGK
jgi:NitT/TauT family transport system substrate-binding protein